MNVERQINVLKTVAEDVAPVSNARVACMIVYKGKVISIGINQNKTHPNSYKYSKNDKAVFIHAEVDAINKAKKKLSNDQIAKATIIVCRIKYNNDTKQQVFGLSKPCKGCQKYISDVGISDIIYTENCENDKEMKYMVWKK